MVPPPSWKIWLTYSYCHFPIDTPDKSCVRQNVSKTSACRRLVFQLGPPSLPPQYCGPSLSGSLSIRGSLSDVSKIFCCCYSECIYFSLSPKVTSLMWLQFLDKQGGVIGGDYCISMYAQGFLLSIGL